MLDDVEFYISCECTVVRLRPIEIIDPTDQSGDTKYGECGRKQYAKNTKHSPFGEAIRFWVDGQVSV